MCGAEAKYNQQGMEITPASNNNLGAYAHKRKDQVHRVGIENN
jgi:ribosomal protein S7